MNKDCFKFKLLLLVLLLSSIVFAQGNKSNIRKTNYIPWTKERKLKVGDFKLVKKKFKENDYTGMTYTDIQYEYKIIKDSVFVTIRCVFNTHLSWLNISDTTQAGLAHEQGHFDIGEIIVRQMRRDFFENYNPKKYSNVNSRLKKLRTKYVKKLNKLNKQYDKETNHSVNKNKQLEWESIVIPDMLAKNESYNNALILIIFP